MKLAFILSAVLMSLSAMASVNCDIYLVSSKADGRPDLTEKILSKFESKGYKFSRIEQASDIKEEGKVSYMSVVSDIQPADGAMTTISLVDLFIEAESITSKSEQKIQISRKPLFGSAENALLKSVEKSIPVCVSRN